MRLRNLLGKPVIISFSRNFVYLRTRKTGSSTIEIVLQDSMGPEDVLGGQCQRDPFSDTYAHMTAAEIIPLVTPEFWSGAFIFSSERHPYEKAVSLAHYNFAKGEKKGRPKKLEFPDFLDRIVQGGSYRGFDHYALDGKVVAQDFIRFETLHADLKRIGERVGFDIPAELPKKKTSFRSDRRPAREILSERQREIVFETCREEFELLGYDP